MRIVLNIVLYLGICNIIISKESFFISKESFFIESYKENIKETRRDTIDLSCINFLDERNKKDSISLSDLGQGELFPSYSGEIKQGFFSVNFIGKTKKERFFWSIYNNKGFFKNNNPYLKNSRDIEKIINKRRGNYYILVVFLSNKYIKHIDKNTGDFELSKNTVNEIYLYENNQWKFIKKEKINFLIIPSLNYYVNIINEYKK